MWLDTHRHFSLQGRIPSVMHLLFVIILVVGALFRREAGVSGAWLLIALHQRMATYLLIN